jgi:hypothetical protein
MDDERTLVPCEFCEQMVYFDDYIQHAIQCRLQTNVTQQEQQDTNHMVLVVQDGEDGNTYRILLDDALRAFQEHLHISDDVNNTNTNETSEISGDENESDEEDYRPRGVQTQTIMVIPRLLATTPDAFHMNDYEFNILLSDRLGRVTVGVEDINAVINDVDEDKSFEESDICAICQETLIVCKNEKKIKISETICGHIYCHPCIESWLKVSKKCPVCQLDLQEMKNNDCKKIESAQENQDT